MGSGSEGTTGTASGATGAATATVTDDQPATDSVSSDLISPATTGCNHVVFCDASGATGTVCHQDGCSLAAAEAECLSDLSAIGCSLHCPAVMQTSSGNVTFRLSCAGDGSCCPANTQYCGPTGRCCDGVHFNSQCPPL